MGRTANSDLALVFLILFLVVPAAGENMTAVLPGAAGDTENPPPYTIQLFIPTQKMIHSDQITGIASGPGGETIIGTSFGLSTYNGSWSTRHQNLDNISEGLMDDYITALELDRNGSLWIGYSGGLQIFDGRTYRSIRDQQLLKETRIKDLERWNNDMWIATGHAGIHQYRNGAWTWYQPMTRKGPGFYEVKSMALDSAGNSLVIATEYEGLWILQLPNDKATFTEISPRYGTWGFLEKVRRDPRGGVYLSNSSMVVHYRTGQGFSPVLETRDLAAGDLSINDITAAPDGRLFIATDNGMFIWEDGTVVSHLNRFEGMGDSMIIRTVSIDAKNRVWFSAPGYVGYYADQAASVIPVELVTSVSTTTGTPVQTPAPQPTAVPAQPVITQDQPFFADDSFLQFLNPVIDPVVKALRAIGSRG